MALDRSRLLKPVKKLKKLVKKMGGQPPPEAVHDLRTNTRRFEAMAKALALETQGIGKSMLKGLGRVRKRAGKVRDMDVLTSFASTVHVDGEEECTVKLLEHLGARRLKLAGKLHREVGRLQPALRRKLGRTPAVVDRLIRKDGGRTGEEAAATAAKLAAQLADPARLNRANLHPYRLKVKALRNVLQMAAGPYPQFVSELGEVKDAIGEWHDWEELVRIAEKRLDHGARCGLTAELKRIAKGKYEDALARAGALRSRYLRNAPGPGKGKVPAAAVWEATATLAA
jgi:CHAD domain-containing protein